MAIVVRPAFPDFFGPSKLQPTKSKSTGRAKRSRRTRTGSGISNPRKKALRKLKKSFTKAP